jgi:hypothetical protein
MAFIALIEAVDRDVINFHRDYLVQIDSASLHYNTSINTYRKLGVRMTYTAPSSQQVGISEIFFSRIKNAKKGGAPPARDKNYNNLNIDPAIKGHESIVKNLLYSCSIINQQAIRNMFSIILGYLKALLHKTKL